MSERVERKVSDVCPRCGALPDLPCRDYLGRVKVTCSWRPGDRLRGRRSLGSLPAGPYLWPWMNDDQGDGATEGQGV